jgi:glucose dehydrogenase
MRWRVLVLLSVCLFLGADKPRPKGEWQTYGGDPGGSKYSPLDQINRKNVSQLKPVWIFDAGDFSDGKAYPGRSAFEATPLLIDGVLYVNTPFHRLFALNPETGDVLWQFDSKFDRSTRVTLYQSRGLAYWEDGSTKRLILADQMARMFSIDPKTGKLDPSFGDNGVVNLKKGMTENFPSTPYGLTSPVAVCGDTIVTGAWVGDGEPRGPAGDIRGWDARTGRQRWIFHTVPRPGEFGHDTWKADSWKDRAGVNVWSIMSVDEANGLVFLPLTSPATDFYGADREGANLFGDSLVALDCKTGQRRWHFQTVHHNLWDYDLPSQPVLMRLQQNGKPVDAVAQITKTGFVFVFDRLTGKPLFPIEERPVPPSTIPGEKSWPTQPHPVKPPPFARQTMTRADLTTVTPESRAECEKLIQGVDIETKLFDPVGEQPIVLFPGTNGGANWGGGSFDPTTGLLYVNSMDVAMFTRMVKREPGASLPYRSQGFGRFWDSNLYPCQQPPWGSLTAIDMNKGEIRWRSVLGEYDELTARGVPKTGASNLGGSIVTAGGLIFIGATNDSKFRAFDKDTGAELWTTRLPASAHATPMTYLGPKSGRQFVVVAAGGGNKYNNKFNPNYSGKLIAFAVPTTSDAPEPRLVSAAPSSVPKFRADYKGADEVLPRKVADQPIPFSHKLHANLECAFCHSGAKTQVRATLPTSTQCLECHTTKVRSSSTLIASLKRFHDAGQPVPWVRVYQVPGFVNFSHARHTGTPCSTCHGPVSSRDVLMKEVSTSMTACMGCHVRTKAAVTCTTCHELGQ